MKMSIPVLVMRHRKAVGLALLFLTAFFAYEMRHIRMATYADDLVPKGHPYIAVDKDFRELFGGANIVLIAVTVKEGDIFTTATLQKIKNITEKLLYIPGVNNNSITSLASRKLKDIRSSAWGMKVQPLMYPNVPQSPQELEQLKRAVYTSDMLLGKLVSQDGKSTLIMADFFEEKMDAQIVFQKVMEIKSQEEDATTEIHAVGEPILVGWCYQYAPQMLWIAALTVAVMVVLLYTYFRSIPGMMIPLFSAAVSAIWGLGFTGLMGHNFDPLILVVPFLISARACSHSVQMVERYFEEFRKSGDRLVASEMACRGMWAPGVLGVVVDALGILIVIVAPIPLLAKLAWIGFFWVMSIACSVQMLNPILLSFLPPPTESLMKFMFVEKSALNRLLSRIARWTYTPARWAVMGISVLALAVAAYMTKDLKVGDAHEGTAILWPDSPFNQSVKHINEHFPGVNPLYVIVEGSKEEDIKRPDVIHAIEAYQRTMERNPRVGGTQSITDVIKHINMKFHDDDPRWGMIPNQASEIGSILYMYMNGGEPGDFDRLVNWNFTQANIIVLFKDHKADTIREGILASKEFIQNHPLEGVRFRLCGGVIGLMAAINEAIEASNSLTLVLAFSMIFVMCSLTYRSVVAGILFVIPLAISNLMTFAFMSEMKIGLNINTLPISSLGIGLGVDYGIYIVSRIKEEYPRSQDLRKAILTAMTTAGRAVLFTATTLMSGVIFWYFLSDMRFQAEMGLLMALWMFVSMIGGLVLLPTLIYLLKPRFITRASRSFASGTAPQDIRMSQPST